MSVPTPNIIDAAKKGDLNLVKKLVAEGEDVNMKGPDNETPLYVASLNGRVEVIYFLCKNGANINEKGPHGNTPLCAAVIAFRGYIVPVQILVGYDADITLQNNNGKTPLFIACDKGFFDIVKYFLEKLTNKFRDENRKINRVALTQDVDIPRNDGVTPLFIASENGHSDVVLELLKCNPNLDAVRITDGATPLYVAFQNEHYEIVDLLLSEGAEVMNSINNGDDFNNMIILAVENNNVEIVEFLLSKGINLDIELDNQQTLFELLLGVATENGNEEMIELLNDYNARNKTLMLTDSLNTTIGKNDNPINPGNDANNFYDVYAFLKKGGKKKSNKKKKSKKNKSKKNKSKKNKFK